MDQFDQLAALVLAIAPNDPGRVALGTAPRDPGYVESLGGLVLPDQLQETLKRCEGDNLQLYWPATSPAPALEVIAELYDDHIELRAGPPFTQGVERAVADIEARAS